MHKVVVIRNHFFGNRASLGQCMVYDPDFNLLFEGVSLERGWVNNQNRVSCIPTGIYPLVLEASPRFRKDLWEVKNVPGRSECKFHVSNYWYQLNGCISLGRNKKFIDGDLIKDVTSSRDTMKDFHDALKGQTIAELHVLDVKDLTKYRSL